jgi:hypothetical protein
MIDSEDVAYVRSRTDRGRKSKDSYLPNKCPIGS